MPLTRRWGLGVGTVEVSFFFLRFAPLGGEKYKRIRVDGRLWREACEMASCGDGAEVMFLLINHTLNK